MPKESEISNEKQINNKQIEALPVVTLDAGKALINYKYQIPPIVKLVVLYIENRVMDFQSAMQKNSKIPSMKLFLIDMNEANKHVASCYQSHLASPRWLFKMIVIGKSELGKTNILTNLFLSDKAKYIYKGKKGSRRYISCDNLIVCGYHSVSQNGH
ncbi:760_t:CDS:2 [Cetraspora pellucida]|uniref:760_t:CDS:1 n=1 Tax=Cetraspora pellucida TaxID=1433469 RepID=A0A9N9B0D7_9GLOM|nr:760_t:CDS:2 [Cetraspora pellucida]